MILLDIQLASPIANKVDFALICDDFKIEVIFLLKQVLDKSCKDPNPLRHRIEHLGLCTVEQIEQAAKLNLALSFFVAHLYFYGKTYNEHIFGPERTNRWTPLSAATKAGLRWSIHQDHATFPGPPLPFANIKTAVTRTQRDEKEKVYGSEYCVTIHEAMKAVTIDAAWQLHKDDCLGSLREGKKADLVIVSDNPYKVITIKKYKMFITSRPWSNERKYETDENHVNREI